MYPIPIRCATISVVQTRLRVSQPAKQNIHGDGCSKVIIIEVKQMKQTLVSMLLKKQHNEKPQFRHFDVQQSEQAFDPRQDRKRKNKKIIKVIHNSIFFYYDKQGNRKTLIYQKVTEKESKDQIQSLKKAENDGNLFSSKIAQKVYRQMHQNCPQEPLCSILVPIPLFPQQHYSFSQNLAKVE